MSSAAARSRSSVVTYANRSSRLERYSASNRSHELGADATGGAGISITPSLRRNRGCVTAPTCSSLGARRPSPKELRSGQGVRSERPEQPWVVGDRAGHAELLEPAQ